MEVLLGLLRLGPLGVETALLGPYARFLYAFIQELEGIFQLLYGGGGGVVRSLRRRQRDQGLPVTGRVESGRNSKEEGGLR